MRFRDRQKRKGDLVSADVKILQSDCAGLPVIDLAIEADVLGELVTGYFHGISGVFQIGRRQSGLAIVHWLYFCNLSLTGLERFVHLEVVFSLSAKTSAKV